jgi:transcriptional regulator with XRE-family HTH domain
MIADLIATMADKEGFSVDVYPSRSGVIGIETSDVAMLAAVMLRRQREKHGLSMADVATCLGARSKAVYARHEQGRTVPSVEKLFELIAAVAPGESFGRPGRNARATWRLSSLAPQLAGSGTMASTRIRQTPSAWRFHTVRYRPVRVTGGASPTWKVKRFVPVSYAVSPSTCKETVLMATSMKRADVNRARNVSSMDARPVMKPFVVAAMYSPSSVNNDAMALESARCMAEPN